jgi:hypothetical protein
MGHAVVEERQRKCKESWQLCIVHPSIFAVE